MVSALLVLLAMVSSAPPKGAWRQEATYAEPDRPFIAEKKWALCVGAAAYTDLAPLKYSPNDARAFADVLEKGYGFEPTTVGVISDGVDAKMRPTSASILGELDRLLADRRLDKGDLFVFYFSGHGVGKPSGDYLMPTDVREADAEVSAIPVKTLIGRFVKAGLKNVLVIADACRSGAQNPFGRELQDLGRKSNIAVLLGCAPGQRSYEYPRLEKGVFTHFLVKAMTDRSLTDKTSGALWASSVAKQVAANVKEYTEADYGDDAQVPAVWSEPSQDVLIAAYPPLDTQAKAALGSADAENKAGRLDSQRYARYLAATGRAMNDEGRESEAVGVLKTLDGLGLASWRDLSILASALRADDRDNEIGSLVARAVSEPERSAFSEYVILQGRPVYVGIDRYREALKLWTRPQDNGFASITLLVAAMRMRLGDEEARIGREVASFASLYPPDSLEGRFIAANVALGEKRYAEAIALAESAAAMSGGAALRPDLRQLRYAAANTLDDPARIEAIIAEGVSDPEDGYPWIERRLRRMKHRKDPELLEAARAFAGKTDSDANLTAAIRALGPDAEVLLPDAQRLQTAHPFSWRAAINVWLADMAQKDARTLEPIPEAAFKYAPNRADLIGFALGRYTAMVEDAVGAGKIDSWYAQLVRGGVLGQYVEYWEDVKESPAALVGFAQTLVRSPQTLRGGLYARTYLWPYAQKQEYAGRELRILCLYLAINSGQEDLAKEVFARLESDGELAPRPVVRYAIFQALNEEEPEAERALRLWDGLGLGEAKDGVKAYFDAIHAYLAIRRGDKAGAQALVDRIDRAESAAAALAYLTQYEIGGRGEINPELMALVSSPEADFADVRIHTLRTLIEGYAKQKTPLAKEMLTKLSVFLTDFPTHPVTREIGFEARKGRSLYTGVSQWTGSVNMGGIFLDATMTLALAPSGNAYGTIEIPSANTKWKISGELDEYGTITADLIENDVKTVFFVMRIPPNGVEKRGGAIASTNFKGIIIGNPPQGMELSMKCVKSATTAEYEAAAKAGDRGASTKPQAKKTPATKTPATKTPGTKTPGTKSPATKTPATKTPATKTPATKNPGGKGTNPSKRPGRGQAGD